MPVTCKIRVFTDLQKTLDYAKMLQRAGCSVLAVHGRTREQKDAKSVRADWEIIKVSTCSLYHGHGQASRAVMLHMCPSQLEPHLWPWTCSRACLLRPCLFWTDLLRLHAGEAAPSHETAGCGLAGWHLRYEQHIQESLGR